MGTSSDLKIDNPSAINSTSTTTKVVLDEVAIKVKSVNSELLDRIYSGMINGGDMNQIKGLSEVYKNING